MKTIRKSRIEDIPELMEIYKDAREKMVATGNLYQWKPGYPTEDMVRKDIAAGNGYAILENGTIVGAFACIFGKDPTYRLIEGGQWLDDKKTYATIHRLGSKKDASGIAEACFSWCWNKIRNLRTDTHKDNSVMQHCIEKAGFKYCGIIYLANGAPRNAYQKIQTASDC